MTPAERAQEAIEQAQLRRLAKDYDRLQAERDGCSSDAAVIRWDDPEREPMIA